MILLHLLFSLFLFSSSESEIANNLLTIERLERNHIQLIPNKGILIASDSILLNKSRIADIIIKLDTSSISYKLIIDKPMGLVMMTQDSPPPCIGDCQDNHYQHKPDEYFVEYNASLIIDSLYFQFGFVQSGKQILEYKDFVDSLKLNSITISHLINAGVYDDLKIGDSYEQIFKHYDKPNYCYQSDMIRKEYRENGILFIIENDVAQKDNYGKILKIKIDGLNKY